ncbi:hypothetical protein [Micromonospora trifolii]|uniref:hypothetical protein n=1 Tax=Micromonospora trifolii TaxID=2911208 RepID=UPI003CF3CE08
MMMPLEYGGRRFQVMAYHDAMRHDGPALELAELVDGELGPALVTITFANESAGGTEVLLIGDLESAADDRTRGPESGAEHSAAIFQTPRGRRRWSCECRSVWRSTTWLWSQPTLASASALSVPLQR